MDGRKPDTAEVVSQNVHMFDTYYRKPDWWFRFRYDTQVKRKTCLHLLKTVGRSLSNQRVLEIGFGSGEVLFSFNRNCELHGIELSDSAIEQAEQKARRLGYKDFRFQRPDGEWLPYPDEHFDIIIASHVLEHVEDDRKLLREMRRTLNREGVVVILIPINENYQDPNHLRRYTPEEFHELVKGSSLVLLDQLENELLFHLVEKFYFEEYYKRWKLRGRVIAMLFNVPTAVLPFGAYQLIDRVMNALGWQPRQLGCILAKPGSDTEAGS
jgi:ubiquinone/menaquinone biosynthesis C-methylase UbiE